jgi:hypothetical protein
MGSQLSTVATKIGDHPSKCLEVNIDVRRGSPERFFLIPITPLTMPTPQSPLCVMLNEALSAPSAVPWAWPPVSNIETPFTGVADDRLALTEASRAVPSVEQTFAHALPRQGTSHEDKGEGHAAAVELGHLLTFVAVECPVDYPIGRGQRPRHRGDRPVPQSQEEDDSIFFDFSAEWLASIYQNEECTVVGYLRYLNLFDLPSPGAHSVTPAATMRGTAPMVSVIDHYLFKGFCYEARAFMLLEAVSFYCQRFANLYGDRMRGSLPKRGGHHRAPPPGAAFPILMRCRSMNLPILRLFQKLYRVHVREGCGDLHRGGAKMMNGENAPQVSRPDRNRSAVNLIQCGGGEVLHVHLTPELAHVIAAKLSDKVSLPGKGKQHHGASCTVKLDKGLMVPTPTPFDVFIERHRERWLIENGPFRKNNGNPGSSDDGEETHKHEAHRPLPLPLPSRLSLTTTRENDFTPSSLPSADVSPSSMPRSGALASSAGSGRIEVVTPSPGSVSAEQQEVDLHSWNDDHAWESSGTSLETLVAPLHRTMRHIRSDSTANDPPTPASLALLTLKPKPDEDSRRTVVTLCVSSSGNTANRFGKRSTWGDLAFLQPGTPIQVSNGDGLWICGYWLEACRPLNLHWFDPSLSGNVLLEHFGPVWIRDLVGEDRLMTPTSTGKVYVAVAPHVPVFPSPHLEGDSVELRALFERNYA